MGTTAIDHDRDARSDHTAPAQAGPFERAWTELREVVRGHATLAVLEAQRAGISFLVLVGIALAMTMLAVTAWLALLTALMVWVGGEALSWPAILLIVAVLNVLLAGGLALLARSYLTELPFSATLRQLRADAHFRRRHGTTE